MKNELTAGFAGIGCLLIALGLLIVPALTYFGLIPVVEQLTGTRLNFWPTLMTALLLSIIAGGGQWGTFTRQ